MKVDLKKVLSSSLSADTLLTDTFLPFLPADNYIEAMTPSGTTPSVQLTESTTSVHHHIHALTLLLKMNVLIFLKNIQDNKSLHTFLESYLTYRIKPYLNLEDELHSSVSLYKLDKLVSVLMSGF